MTATPVTFTVTVSQGRANAVFVVRQVMEGFITTDVLFDEKELVAYTNRMRSIYPQADWKGIVFICPPS